MNFGALGECLGFLNRPESPTKKYRCERQLLHTIKVRRSAYLGHILRHEKYELPQLVIEKEIKIEGKRGIGRKKVSLLRNIRQRG